MCCGVGAAYGWGMGSTMQLGQGDDESDVYEPVIIAGKQLENKFVLFVDCLLNCSFDVSVENMQTVCRCFNLGNTCQITRLVKYEII